MTEEDDFCFSKPIGKYFKYWFSNTGTALSSWDESHLAVVYNSSYMSLDDICQCLDRTLHLWETGLLFNFLTIFLSGLSNMVKLASEWSETCSLHSVAAFYIFDFVMVLKQGPTILPRLSQNSRELHLPTHPSAIYHLSLPSHWDCRCAPLYLVSLFFLEVCRPLIVIIL